LELDHTKIIVSTVGGYRKPGTQTYSEIGWQRDYETMVFWAKADGPYLDADVSHEIHLNSPWALKYEGLPETDILANNMHETAVLEIACRMAKGRLVASR